MSDDEHAHFVNEITFNIERTYSLYVITGNPKHQYENIKPCVGATVKLNGFADPDTEEGKARITAAMQSAQDACFEQLIRFYDKFREEMGVTT